MNNQHTRRGMAALRRLGMQLLNQGAAQAEVMRELGVSRTTACNWAAANTGEVPVLPVRTLSEPDMAHLRKILDGSARVYGFPSDTWTIARMAVMIEWELGLKCSTLNVFRMLGSAMPRHRAPAALSERYPRA